MSLRQGTDENEVHPHHDSYHDLNLQDLTKGEIIAIGLGSACMMFLVLGLLYLGYRLLHRRKSKLADYEKISPLSSAGGSSIAGTPIIPDPTDTSCMKTIPFTVPTSVSPRSLRGSESRFGDDAASTSSGSEPTTPLGLQPSKGSMESLGSSSYDIRGAYSLGNIDPSLYKMTDEMDDYDFCDGHIGRIWFAVEYERESEKLLVTLMKAKNLPSRSMSNNNSCDPFVRIYLMPDERRFLQSKFKKKTCHPKFEESFVFQVSNKTIEERVLKLTVYDLDRHKRHQVIGHALFPLKSHDYESNERVVIWRDLEREIQETGVDKGEVHVSLAYNNHLERLTIGIFEGKNFKRVSDASSDFYMKVALLLQNKIIKTKKTEVIKKSCNPVFNESFTLKLSANALDTASLSITAMQHVIGHRDKALGRIILGSFMFARGKELEHWNEMASNQREQVSQWHVLT